MSNIRIKNSGIKPSILIGGITLLVFGTGGYLLIEFGQSKSFLTLFSEGKSFFIQILAGGISGLVAAGLALSVINRKFFSHHKNHYFNLISQWKLTYGEMVFLSFCAGTAEELFFRAGLQPLLGIWLTSVLFVLLHGYLNLKNWRISIYGILMVGVIGGFGYIYEYFGIYSVMTAHALFDLVLFLYIDRQNTESIKNS